MSRIQVSRVVAIDSFWFAPDRPQTLDDSDIREQWRRYYSAETQAALPNFALNDHTPLRELLTAIRAPEANQIGHTARYALVAYRGR